MQKPAIFERLLAIFRPKTTPKKNATKTTPKEFYVFITAKGKKFHYDPCCSSLHSAKPVRMDLSKARKAGYKACDKCCYSYLHD